MLIPCLVVWAGGAGPIQGQEMTLEYLYRYDCQPGPDHLMNARELSGDRAIVVSNQGLALIDLTSLTAQGSSAYLSWLPAINGRDLYLTEDEQHAFVNAHRHGTDDHAGFEVVRITGNVLQGIASVFEPGVCFEKMCLVEDLLYKNPDLWQRVRQRQTAWLEEILADQSGGLARWHVLLTHIPLYNGPWCSVRSRSLWTPSLRDWKPDLALSGHDHQWRPAQPVPPGIPWPSLVGGGPAAAGGEEGTMMILSADDKTLRVRLIGAKDGPQLTEFVVER